MDNDLISRQAAIAKLRRIRSEPDYQHEDEDWSVGVIISEDVICDLPTVDTERHGEWENDRATIKCNNCGFGTFPTGWFFMNGECFSTYFKPVFCPNCGCRMDGEKRGDDDA